MYYLYIYIYLSSVGVVKRDEGVTRTRKVKFMDREKRVKGRRWVSKGVQV